MNNEIIRLTNDSPVFVTSTPKSIADKKAVFAALNSDGSGMEEYINKNFHIKWFKLERVTRQRKDDDGNFTGELYDAVQSTIITGDGGVIKTSASGIAKSLASLVQFFGLPEDWDEDYTFSIRASGTGRYRTHKVVIID